MEKLTSEQLEKLHNHLISSTTNDVLVGELLDHLACEAEGYLKKGYAFEEALEAIAQEANTMAVKYLRETYQHEVAMTEAQLQSASLDDIIFEFRNKAYGAYDLRQNYPLALRNALILGIGLFVMLMAFLSGISQGTWDFFSASLGIAWLVGLAAVGFAVATWFYRDQQINFFKTA